MYEIKKMYSRYNRMNGNTSTIFEILMLKFDLNELIHTKFVCTYHNFFITIFIDGTLLMLSA